jgi:hypothetical protein
MARAGAVSLSGRGRIRPMSMLELLERAGALAPATVRRSLKQIDFVRRLQERRVVTRNFERMFGRPPDLRHPTTFNEKVAYKILYDRRPILTRLADKLRARDYVAERIGGRYLAELFQVCRSAAEIDWRKLPRRFVLKTNHGNAMNIFVPDKTEIDVGQVSARLDAWLAINLYDYSKEWCYRDIEPAILVEEMLTEADGAMAIDWKFFTFDGRTEFLQVDIDRFTEQKRNVYDRNLARLPFRGRHPNAPADPKFPENIELMFSLADRLGRGLDFIRVDMYNLGGRVVFGEFTNYPGAGQEPFHPPEFDELFGSKWRVPARYR